VVTAVTGFGLFVELTDIYVEGLVHVTALPADYYHFDPVHHRLSGERSGRSFRLGDSVEVLVARVDLDERKIDFELGDNPLSVQPARKRQVKAGEGKAAPGKRGAPHEPAPLEQSVSTRRQAGKTGRVRALPEVAPELLEQAELLLGNVDVEKSRALKKKLLEDAKAPAKPSAKSDKGKSKTAAGKTADKKKAVPRPVRVSGAGKGKSKVSRAPATDASAGRAIRKRKVEE
jgi:ribonuclease R